MTPAQKARTQGFLASLSWRGESLFLHPDGTEIVALVEPHKPDDGEFSMAREEANSAKIHALRTDIGSIQIGKGSVLKSADGLTTYRVTAVENNPASVAVILTAELATAQE